MIGTTLIRESPAAPRTGPSRPVTPPVLIEVPALPGTRPHRPPTAARPAPGPRARPRRRLRREVRLVGAAAMLGVAVLTALIALRGPAPAAPEVIPADGAIAADPFAIELDHPIPDPSPSPATEPGPRIETPPVAFPGYLLPGDGLIAEEAGHARP